MTTWWASTEFPRDNAGCYADPGRVGSAHAQSAIAGVVRDTSGAVLPGVTVEAASPALIEKVRTVNTDAEGLYRVIDLRPGTYTVTFTLPGFSIVTHNDHTGGNTQFPGTVEFVAHENTKGDIV